MEGSCQNLLVLWGVPVRAKAELAATLAHALHTSGRTVTLLDNGDVPVPAAALPPVAQVHTAAPLAIPVPVADFTGREAELADLTAALATVALLIPNVAGA